MGRRNSDIKNINLICIFASVLIVLPLLILGHYNYPCADDWSFGAGPAQTFAEGESLWEILREAGRVVMLWREKGEPRYANAFLGALQPGIFGEHFYRIVPWIMIGSLIISETALCGYLLRDRNGENKKWILPIVLPTLALQILCVPYPEESFYWYTGSVNYTFIFSLSVLLLLIFLVLKRGGMRKSRTLLAILGGMLIAALVGGDSYAASLSAVCFFSAFSVILAIRDRRALLRTLPITIVTITGFLLCLTAPGNQSRLNSEFGGKTTGAVYAIIMSLVRTGTNIFSWTSLKIIIMIILILPFLWKAIKNIEGNFRYPLLFSIFSFSIYATQITATMYVDGSTGGARMADVLYYAYHVWLMLNVGYWIGWLQRKGGMERLAWYRKLAGALGRRLLTFFCTVGIILAVFMGATELRTLSTYKACAWLVNGTAREYAQAWEERLAVLHDESVKEVYFEPLPGYEGEMIFYADLQYDENNWLNKACAEYYNKNFVKLK